LMEIIFSKDRATPFGRKGQSLADVWGSTFPPEKYVTRMSMHFDSHS
jgi:hypothetical protein